MDNALLSSFLSTRELLFLGGGAASLGIGAALLHARAHPLRSARARTFLASLATAFLASGVILARAGF